LLNSTIKPEKPRGAWFVRMDIIRQLKGKRSPFQRQGRISKSRTFLPQKERGVNLPLDL